MIQKVFYDKAVVIHYVCYYIRLKVRAVLCQREGDIVRCEKIPIYTRQVNILEIQQVYILHGGCLALRIRADMPDAVQSTKVMLAFVDIRLPSIRGRGHTELKPQNLPHSGASATLDEVY